MSNDDIMAKPPTYITPTETQSPYLHVTESLRVGSNDNVITDIMSDPTDTRNTSMVTASMLEYVRIELQDHIDRIDPDNEFKVDSAVISQPLLSLSIEDPDWVYDGWSIFENTLFFISDETNPYNKIYIRNKFVPTQGYYFIGINVHSLDSGEIRLLDNEDRLLMIIDKPGEYFIETQVLENQVNSASYYIEAANVTHDDIARISTIGFYLVADRFKEYIKYWLLNFMETSPEGFVSNEQLTVKLDKLAEDILAQVSSGGSGDLTRHLLDVNPHGITPILIGAALEAHTHTATDLPDLQPADIGAADRTHVHDYTEIENLTPENIGAADRIHTHDEDIGATGPQTITNVDSSKNIILPQVYTEYDSTSKKITWHKFVSNCTNIHDITLTPYEGVISKNTYTVNDQHIEYMYQYPNGSISTYGLYDSTKTGSVTLGCILDSRYALESLSVSNIMSYANDVLTTFGSDIPTGTISVEYTFPSTRNISSVDVFSKTNIGLSKVIGVFVNKTYYTFTDGETAFNHYTVDLAYTGTGVKSLKFVLSGINNTELLFGVTFTDCPNFDTIDIASGTYSLLNPVNPVFVKSFSNDEYSAYTIDTIENTPSLGYLAVMKDLTSPVSLITPATSINGVPIPSKTTLVDFTDKLPYTTDYHLGVRCSDYNKDNTIVYDEDNNIQSYTYKLDLSVLRPVFHSGNTYGIDYTYELINEMPKQPTMSNSLLKLYAYHTGFGNNAITESMSGSYNVIEMFQLQCGDSIPNTSGIAYPTVINNPTLNSEEFTCITTSAFIPELKIPYSSTYEFTSLELNAGTVNNCVYTDAGLDIDPGYIDSNIYTLSKIDVQQNATIIDTKPTSESAVTKKLDILWSESFIDPNMDIPEYSVCGIHIPNTPTDTNVVTSSPIQLQTLSHTSIYDDIDVYREIYTCKESTTVKQATADSNIDIAIAKYSGYGYIGRMVVNKVINHPTKNTLIPIFNKPIIPQNNELIMPVNNFEVSNPDEEYRIPNPFSTDKLKLVFLSDSGDTSGISLINLTPNVIDIKVTKKGLYLLSAIRVW